MYHQQTLLVRVRPSSNLARGLKFWALMLHLLKLVVGESMKTECDYLNGWMKNGHIRKSLSQNGEPQRYRRGRQKKKKKLSGIISWYNLFFFVPLLELLGHRIG